MRHEGLTRWLAIALMLAVAGTATADDRDFLRIAAAEPNLIFILDTSSSMVLSPEVTLDGDPPSQSAVEGALVSGANVPGGGDDPYSRMGIAKRVLRDFLSGVVEANVALAGYAQAQPADGSNGVPQKHWVYEARASDRFHMVESNYAYRFGYNETYNGLLIDNPGLIHPQAMIGYSPYFDPGSSAVTDRFGPTNAYDTGYTEILEDTSVARLPFDLMPMYFGNCIFDDKGTPSDATDDELHCTDSVFPFYDSGARESDGTMIVEQWYYGDPATRTFTNCTPSKTPTADNPDDGCLAEWEETSGANLNQWKRRVHLEIPETFGGNPNHFLAVDASGTRVGNTEVSDTPGNDDYDPAEEGSDPDYDGSETSDWELYVASVEQTAKRECFPPQRLPSLTPTPPYSEEELCQLYWTELTPLISSYGLRGAIRNNSPFTARIVGTYFDWGAGHSATKYVERLCLYSTGLTSPSACPSTRNYWDDNGGSSAVGDGKYARPLDVSEPFVNATGTYSPTWSTGTTRGWWGILVSSAEPWNGIYEVCVDVALQGANPDGSDFICTDICTVTTAGSAATPTNTPVNTATPTRTPTAFVISSPSPTATGVAGTPTRTNTPGILPTSTPTATHTATPRPPTPTQTPSRTPTPVG